MTACVSDVNNQQFTLPDPVAWRLEYTAGVPCDSFWVQCLWDQNNSALPGDWVGFHAIHLGERVFTGVVDECEVKLSAKGQLLEISGRGMAARLLDNEALGQDYQLATLADIIRDHVKPYNISVLALNSMGVVTNFSVATGSSEWSVIYDFAQRLGGIIPRFNQQGALMLSGWDDRQVRVVDDQSPLISLLRRDKRYGVLSQVLVRDRWSGQIECVTNDAFQSSGGQARRIITMPTRSDYKTMRYSGTFQLDKSAAELARLEVTIGDSFCVWPGELVSLNRSGWAWNGQYRAAQVTVGMDEQGCWTRMDLAAPDFVV